MTKNFIVVVVECILELVEMDEVVTAVDEVVLEEVVEVVEIEVVGLSSIGL